MVLDIQKYKSEHPGGKFLINYNIGRDISKFFYGGYALENFSGRPLTNAHSNVARHIVNTLIIARLIKKAPEFKAKIIEK